MECFQEDISAAATPLHVVVKLLKKNPNEKIDIFKYTQSEGVIIKILQLVNEKDYPNHLYHALKNNAPQGVIDYLI